jgi:hypothetical protein
MTSVLERPMIVSANALSQESPVVPTEASIPASAKRSVYRIERYWLPLAMKGQMASSSSNIFSVP